MIFAATVLATLTLVLEIANSNEEKSGSCGSDGYLALCSFTHGVSFL